MKQRVLAAGALISALALAIGCGAGGRGSASASATAASPAAQVPAGARQSSAAVSAAGPASAGPASAGQATAQQASTQSAGAQPNPAGDIPDSQTFVRYSPPDGAYSVELPEGWARSSSGSVTSWTQQYDGVSMSLSRAAGEPALADMSPGRLKSLDAVGGMPHIAKVEQVLIHGRKALVAYYYSESAPDPVTNKSLKLENEAYFFFNSGKLAALRLWAPAGADNVDQWRRISRSFEWK